MKNFPSIFFYSSAYFLIGMKKLIIIPEISLEVFKKVFVKDIISNFLFNKARLFSVSSITTLPFSVSKSPSKKQYLTFL